MKITESLTMHVINQVELLQVDKDDTKLKISQAIAARQKINQDALDKIKQDVSDERNKVLEAISEPGASSWLTSLPISKYGFHLDKSSFQGALCLRYNFELRRLPLNCVCGATYTTAHVVSCKRGGFTIIRHNDIRDATVEILREVCHEI